MVRLHQTQLTSIYLTNMFAELASEFFSGVFKFFLWAAFIILALLGIIIYFGFFMSGGHEGGEYRTNKRINPEVEINTKIVNGVTHSDTTFVYKLSK